MAKKLVFIDPGHVSTTYAQTGGKGVTRGGVAYPEYDFNKDVGNQAVTLLKKSGIDARITSQSKKTTESLTARTNEANNAGADLLISVHANAGVAAANGACIFHWRGASEGFADLWVDEWKKANTGVGNHGNGKHEVVIGTWTNLHMVREAAMPAYLIEHGFMTNDHDFDYIFGSKKKAYRRKSAEVIAKTVCRHFGITYKGGSTTPTEPSKPSKPSNPNTGSGSTGGIKTVGHIEIVNVANAAFIVDKPSTNSTNLDTAKLGSKWAISGSVPNWWEIVYKGKRAYVNAKFGKKVDSKSGTTKAATTTSKKTNTSTKLPTGVLVRGSSGAAVKQVQEALNKLKFKVGKVDGVYGGKTEDAVRRFQSVYDPYNVDGKYGPKTRKLMLEQLK